MNREQVARWLAAYVEAWKTYDPDRIGELFSEDAEYRYHPYDEPLRGREAIVESWLSEEPTAPGASTRDAPGSYDAGYEPAAVDGDVAVATGTSSYYDSDGELERVFHNCFLLRFDPEGRCREFTEWFIEHPDPPNVPRSPS